MRRPKKKATTAATGPTPVQDKRPAWVRAMHAYFGETGTYRAADVQRVLGDPRKAVEGPVSSELATASRSRRD